MAYSANTFVPLSSMANSNSTRMFTYATADAKATIVASGYFDAAAANNGLQQGDIIWSVSSNGGTETFEAIFVDAITAGVVTTLSSSLTLA